MSDVNSLSPVPSPRPSSTRWFILFPLVLCVISLGAWSALAIRLMAKKPAVRIAEVSAPVITPEQSSAPHLVYEEAVLFSQPHTAEHVALVSADDHLDGLPPGLLAQIDGIPADDRIRLRCSERIVNEEEGFFIREANTHAVSQHVTAEPYFSLMRSAGLSVSLPYQLLTARFCETEKGNLLFEYSIGTMPGHHPDDAEDATMYLAYIERGKPFAAGIPVLHYDVWPYPGCRRPLAMTHEGIAYYECGVVTSGEVNATYHRIDFRKKESEQIAKCLFSYKGKPKKTCQEKG